MNALHTVLRLLVAAAMVCSLLPGILAAPASAQAVFDFKDLTRARLWARLWNSGGVGQPTLGGQEYYKYDYPGHALGSNVNDHGGWLLWSGYMTWAEIDGIGYPFRVLLAYDHNPTFISPVEGTKLIANYNMADPSLKAEEIVTGAHRINEYDVRVDFRALAWSYPDYDDFIIQEYTFTNEGSSAITNFRFAPTGAMNIALPIRGRSDDDVYEWDIAHEAFYFRDGVERDGDTANPAPPRPFGLTRSDLGEPADLDAPSAINHEFLAPQYFTYYWLDKPVKSDPSERDHMNIVDKSNLNQHSNRIQDDPLNDNPEVDFDTDNYIYQSLTYDQPLPPETEDGQSLAAEAARLGLTTRPRGRYEYHIDYIYETGPYEMAPGQSLKFVLVVAAGMMDMKYVAEGGLENEARLPEGGVRLWKHVDAAQELYDRGYEAPDPPPTPTNGNNSLTLTAIPLGIKVQWPAIPDSYRDPDYNVNDVAGYRVYRSTHRNIGPWTMIADIPVNAAEMEGGMVTYNDSGLELGVGVYYTVTSYDTGHNTPWPGDPSITSLPSLESGQVNVNVDPVYPQAKPSDNLDDIRVYPNPFFQHSQLLGEGERYRIEFVNIPAQCTIRIYTLAGELVRVIDHTDGSGDEAWGSRATADYQVNEYLQRVAPGIYLFHVESHVPGHEGESKVGKFVIVK